MTPEQSRAIATLAKYASAYPGCLDGIAENFEHEGKRARAEAYRTAWREISAEIDAARAVLDLD